MAPRRFPRTAVAVDVQSTDRRFPRRKARNVLLLGELHASQREELEDRGGVIVQANDTHEAFELLATTDFDVVVVDPVAPGNGLDLVTAVKESASEHLHTVATLYGARGDTRFLRGARLPNQETLVAVRSRHRLTAFVVLPVNGEAEYAIVVSPPEGSFLKHPSAMPLVTAIMTVDASKLVTRRLNTN